MPCIQRQEDGQSDVRREEIRRAPVLREEDVEAIRQSQDDQNRQSGVRSVGLEGRRVRESVQGVVELQRPPEAQVRDQAHDPADEPADRRQVGEPSEDLRAAVGDVQVGQQPEGPGREDRGPGDAVAVCLGEEFGRLVCEGQAVEGAAAGEEEGVSCGPGGGEDCGIYHVVQHWDSGVLDPYYEGRGAGVGVGR